MGTSSFAQYMGAASLLDGVWLDMKRDRPLSVDGLLPGPLWSMPMDCLTNERFNWRR